MKLVELPHSDVKVLIRLCTFPLLTRFFDFMQREGLGEAQTLGESSYTLYSYHLLWDIALLQYESSCTNKSVLFLSDIALLLGDIATGDIASV